MKRRAVNLIVAVDRHFGIGLNGTLPWRFAKEMAHFKNTTVESSVVMGRKTWESIPSRFKPLVDRENIVITSDKTYDAKGADTYHDFDSVIAMAKETTGELSSKPIFIIGGSTLYQQALKSELVDNVYLSIIDKTYGCDTHLPSGLLAKFKLDAWKQEDDYCHIDGNTHNINYLKLTRTVSSSDKYWWQTMPQFITGEHRYLALLRMLLNQPLRVTRNASTYSSFDHSLSYNLLEGFPAMSTKKLYWKGVCEELNFFINGETDAKALHARGVRIWDFNTTREFLDDRGLSHYETGDMGPMYGWVWRHMGADYTGCDTDYTGCGFDQLKDVINRIKTNPTDRRILMTSYDPSKVSESVLAPCHSIVIQFYCDKDGNYLDCTMYQRSADIFLGVPFNIASTSLLLSMIAKVTGRTARHVNIKFGDLHLYESHVNAAFTQLLHPPLELPTLELPDYDSKDDPLEYLESIRTSNAKLIGYKSHPSIKAKMIA